MIDAIGGYFGAEPVGVGSFPHQHGVLLNTGRNALEYILCRLPVVNHVYLPYYTCEVVLEPLRKLGISYTQYHVNHHLEIDDDIVLDDNEYIIVNNYFGVKDAYVSNLLKKYGEKIIVDSSQAFFAPVLPETKMFYSMRKYVGVADGGVAYPCLSDDWKSIDYDDNSNRSGHLRIRIEEGAEAGFKVYQANEALLDGQPIKQMARQTREILQNIDYKSVIVKRRANYSFLHDALRDSNRLELPDMNTFVCPMVYPYLPKDAIKGLRSHLQKNRIYTAKYWPNIVDWCKINDWEFMMSNDTIFLPIDQRCGLEDMDRIINVINSIV